MALWQYSALLAICLFHTTTILESCVSQLPDYNNEETERAPSAGALFASEIHPEYNSDTTGRSMEIRIVLLYDESVNVKEA